MTPDRYLLSSFIAMSVGFWLALLSGSILFGVVGGYFAALVVFHSNRASSKGSGGNPVDGRETLDS